MESTDRLECQSKQIKMNGSQVSRERNARVIELENLKTITRRERLKSAPYLRLKKRKTLFLTKIEIFEKNFSFKRSRIVPKNVKGGTLLDLLTNIPLQNIKKLKGGDLLGTLKNFRKKVAQCQKKSKGGTLWARPVLYVSLKK